MSQYVFDFLWIRTYIPKYTSLLALQYHHSARRPAIGEAILGGHLSKTSPGNGPDKNESNNGNEDVGLQKCASFSIICTYF